jgi:predicted DsbA family dithiol-disulfide isomerase
MEALLRAYFTRGRDIGDRQTLLDVVAEVWLDRRKAAGVLDGDEGLEAINETDALVRRFGVGGVPFFIVNDSLTLPGAPSRPTPSSQCFGRRLDSKS